MAQDTSGAGAAGGTLVIPGEMAARVDRLPMSLMAWEICLIVQVGWACAASTDGIAQRLYPFVWLPAKVINHTQYDVLYAFQAGISIVIGGYALGWLADKIGRRKVMIITILNFSIATGLMALTPEHGWVFLVICRVLVGFGVTGLYTVDIAVVQEFVPAYRRGWITGVTTTMLPAGSFWERCSGSTSRPMSAGAVCSQSGCCRRH